ncbi:MAG: hypothetical protein IPH78_03975 [Bacteroidetes bacterium]|nr:hypothetical protein [Bacteroidota bacterium]
MHVKRFNVFKWLSVVLLLLNAAGAIPAGVLYIADPSGSKMGTTTALLQHSPFSNFLIPGIVLFLANGVCSLVAFALLVSKHKAGAVAVLLQGAILCGWIAIQVYMLRLVDPLHIIMFTVGVLLILSSVAMQRTKRQTP